MMARASPKRYCRHLHFSLRWMAFIWVLLLGHLGRLHSESCCSVTSVACSLSRSSSCFLFANASPGVIVCWLGPWSLP